MVERRHVEAIGKAGKAGELGRSAMDTLEDEWTGGEGESCSFSSDRGRGDNEMHLAVTIGRMAAQTATISRMQWEPISGRSGVCGIAVSKGLVFP